ncbi:hypothetical protein [Sorangium sp. So ce1024]|uniref:hypothetical protein n=1 Tax=Sorangium sp. So ce1024 TaxID=3133327 RepID=UPI003F03DC20
MGLDAAGRRLRLTLATLATLVALAVGCEILVDGELDAVLCSAEGAIGPPACPVGTLCRNGACIWMPTERALGAPCEAHDDCGPLDFCLDPAAFGGEGPRVCARACCTSSDCDPVRDAVCWVPDTGGGGVCRVGRDVGRPEVGTGRTGDPCAAHRDCRSGMCSEGVCIDACCSDTSCAATGAVCRLTTGLISSGSAWACRPPETTRLLGYFEECDKHEECASGLCVGDDGVGGRDDGVGGRDDGVGGRDDGVGGRDDGVGGRGDSSRRRCTIACCSSSMCPAPPGDVTHIVGCAEVDIGGGSMVRACARLLPAQSLSAVGVACADDKECRGGVCAIELGQTQGFCTDVCCGDASCGDVARFGCRPPRTESSWALRCEPK